MNDIPLVHTDHVPTPAMEARFTKVSNERVLAELRSLISDLEKPAKTIGGLDDFIKFCERNATGWGAIQEAYEDYCKIGLPTIDEQCPECGYRKEYEFAYPAEPDTNTPAWRGGWGCGCCGWTKEDDELPPLDDEGGDS